MTGSDGGWAGVEICFLRTGIGVVDNIRRDGDRVWFTFARPGELPENLWLATPFFDQRLVNGDWAAIETEGEGPPEPDWRHSEIRRIRPPLDEPPEFALQIEPVRSYGDGEVMVNVHLGSGRWFSRFKATDRLYPAYERGGWHLPGARQLDGHGSGRTWSDADAPSLPYDVETLLELLYAASRLARSLILDRPQLFEA
ncbi:MULTISPECIES: hypothetical protein [Mycobacterium]|uniref:Uncharacterized protein n=1 Tax=Mycobacterium gordonae TaxID=1778 RepID=A0A1X1VE28_MYCGO|nr:MULTISPECIES: hypothetical protein [Mycobacterium]MCV7008799.1 hypothetical protein [Mycobacterium gordonae]ODR16168.1 hypothetical protein BHQ23_30850 [Mycobacterium gordonae]ORV67296.1 hypothetical protein AWC08_08605 [Mycobacterium gordonae]PJE08635.1 MAG: hypothetical protein CK428_19380 [Mycobacterium sp.]